MVTLCPKCKQAIALRDLEKTGDQITRCAHCGTYISGTYKSDDHREVWELHYEKPRPVIEPPDGEGALESAFIWFLVLIALAGLILFFRTIK